MTPRKINIGAGKDWYKEGWESLESQRGDYVRSCQHFGKAWNTKLLSNCYDVLFAGNILEHVTNFKIEKTLAEFNRIMKKGGIIRITVPDLRKAAEAYINNDTSFFENEKKNKVDHIGIGGMFLNNVVSPGHDVVLLTNDFNEVLGSYAHTYAYDFEMLKIYLQKWGFGNIEHSSFTKSSEVDMQEEQHVLLNGKKFGVFDEEVGLAIHKDPENNFFTGFDSFPEKTLFVEAENVEDIAYTPDLEFEYNQRSIWDGFVNNLKIKLIYMTSILVDFFFIKLPLFKFVKKILGKS